MNEAVVCQQLKRKSNSSRHTACTTGRQGGPNNKELILYQRQCHAGHCKDYPNNRLSNDQKLNVSSTHSTKVVAKNISLILTGVFFTVTVHCAFIIQLKYKY